MSNDNQEDRRRGGPHKFAFNASCPGYGFGSDPNFPISQAQAGSPVGGRGPPPFPQGQGPLSRQNGSTMPTGFDQRLMQYSRPPPGRLGPPPTPLRHQNAGGFQNFGGYQPNTPQPAQLLPAPRGEVQQAQTPGLSGPAARPFSVETGGDYFQNVDQVKAYIQELAWWPSMGTYGIPQTLAERMYYLDKLKAAISSTADVWDRDTASWDFAKFTRFKVGDELLNGEWTGPKDVEAAASAVLTVAMRIHCAGVAGLAFRRSGDYTYHYNEDFNFTFTQRIHFVAWLLEHSKVAASLVMAIQSIDKFVAIPFTTLMGFEVFRDEWESMTAEQKAHFAELIPYEHVAVEHPTEEQQVESRKRSQATYEDAKAREAGNFAPFGSSSRPRNASNPTGRTAPPQQHGGESQDWYHW